MNEEEQPALIDVHILRRHIPLVLVAIILLGFAGFALWGFAFFAPPSVAEYRIELPSSAPSAADFEYGAWPALQNPDFFAQVKTQFIQNKASFIESDLSEMRLRVFKEGALVKEVPILSKGKKGSWWETPAGIYKVEGKEKNHFSSFGKVYMPWSLPFQGNFFIHGWPYYPDGSPVGAGYSGGCIRLSAADAKEVFELAAAGMPILVFEEDYRADNFAYVPQVPGVSAQSYLAGDLKSNTILIEKNSGDFFPIASITKLVTAVVATEYLNIEKEILVSESAVVPTSKPRLKSGDRLTVYQLLHLLLAESSNEAAEAIAQSLGAARFLKIMNEKAAAVGMAETRFADASGMSAGNISTAQDLMALAKYLYHNRSFILELGVGKVGQSPYAPPPFSDIKNLNGFAGDPELVGVKLGKSTAARETILAIFDAAVGETKRPIVVVALGSEDAISDARRILDWVKNVY